MPAVSSNLAEAHAVAGYESAQAIRIANSAAGELHAMAVTALESPEGTEQLISLLSHPVAGSWTAYAALNSGELSELQRARCLAILRALARGNSIDAVGAKAWLNQHGFGA
jgi:hypothetical protein